MSEDFDVRKDSSVIREAQNAYAGVVLRHLLPPLRLAARGCGYSIAVHGSLSRDIDLVAVPWVESADTAEVLVARLCGVVSGVTGRALASKMWADKPHGRRAVIIIHGGHECEIDLSIMPILPKDGK